MFTGPWQWHCGPASAKGTGPALASWQRQKFYFFFPFLSHFAFFLFRCGFLAVDTVMGAMEGAFIVTLMAMAEALVSFA
jgi:hypothetical protein